jgi:DNA-binding transcriptional LysR family regulator
VKSASQIASELDLNLLRVLVALDATRNVSRAAEALAMSQSGFSTALLRLRKHFGDEMFIRTAGAMLPTTRAQRMVITAREVLSRISEEILEKPIFDAATSTAEFRIAMADVAEVIYLPTLLRHLAATAPQATVTTALPAKDELQEGMATGTIDLAIGYFPDLGTQQFFKQRMYTHTYACIARVGHPVGNKLSVRDYERCGHAVASTPARSTALLDGFLARRGVRRRIVLQTPHHLVLPVVVAQTELIATVPLAVASHLSGHPGIQVLALPFVPPSFEVQQHWHRVMHKEPRNQWLRSQVYSLFAGHAATWAALEKSLYAARARSKTAGSGRRQLDRERKRAGAE